MSISPHVWFFPFFPTEPSAAASHLNLSLINFIMSSDTIFARSPRIGSASGIEFPPSFMYWDNDVIIDSFTKFLKDLHWDSFNALICLKNLSYNFSVPSGINSIYFCLSLFFNAALTAVAEPYLFVKYNSGILTLSSLFILSIDVLFNIFL